MTKYSKWVRPKESDLKHEYKIEYEIKPLKSLTGNAFPTFEDFKEAARKGKVTEITPQMDSRISYRSGTTSKEDLLNLIRGYASYPQYRNEKTIDGLYAAFENNTEMTMPLVLEFPDGRLRIMGGNTRMDVAFQLGINPKVLIIKVPKV